MAEMNPFGIYTTAVFCFVADSPCGLPSWLRDHILALARQYKYRKMTDTEEEVRSTNRIEMPVYLYTRLQTENVAKDARLQYC